MYLSRLQLNRTRPALNWISNHYRVHQRLKMGCEADPRQLFRIEEGSTLLQILVQTCLEPNWQKAFDDTDFLFTQPEVKFFDPYLPQGNRYRFRLLANPTVKRQGERLGLLDEATQRAWLERKLIEAGAVLLGCLAQEKGFKTSHKSLPKDAAAQVHFSVLFEGVLQVTNASLLEAALKNGIGPAKAYGFGLLSLAPYSVN